MAGMLPDTKRSAVTVIPMEPRHAGAVARLHARYIPGGALALLGRLFMRELYCGIASDPESRVWVAVEAGRVLGFLAYSRDVARMFKSVIRSRLLRLAFAAVPAVVNPKAIARAIGILRYPSKQSAADLPPAELLSVAVDESARGKGVGAALMQQIVQQAEADNVPALKVLVGAQRAEARRMYERAGFMQHSELRQHDQLLVVYVRAITPAN